MFVIVHSQIVILLSHDNEVPQLLSLFAALQSTHAPFPDLPEFGGECTVDLNGKATPNQAQDADVRRLNAHGKDSVMPQVDVKTSTSPALE